MAIYRDEPALNNNSIVVEFPDDNHNASFKFKQKITGQAGNDGTKDVQKMVPLKCLSYFWRTLEMLLINCEISLFLNWSRNYFILAVTVDNQEPRYAITDAKLYVAVLTFLAQDNTRLLQQLKASFKRTTNWNKYQSEPTTQAPKWSKFSGSK